MAPSVPLLLTRAATVLVTGMLLFAAFAPAHAQGNNQDDSYGLKRFSGDNYDTVPARPSNMPAPAAPAYHPPASTVPYGYKPMAPVAPAYPTQRMTAAPSYAYYRQ